ncbi:MAG TPA: hypothetical protein VH253_11280 [Phycisphaerae bacterium]|nr:hypothetical protein [Phycisphaerae bacterium]
MRKGWLVAWLLPMALGLAAAWPADPDTRPLVIAPAGVGPDRRIVQLLGVPEASDWKGVPLYVQETGLDGNGMVQVRWELRKADTQERVASVDMRLPPIFGGRGRNTASQPPDGQPHGLRTSIMDEAATVLDGLPEGNYVAAFVLDGKRVSNVVTIKRVAKHQVTDEPLVRAAVAEPVMPGEPPVIGVVGVKRTDADPDMGPMQLMMADLIVDGEHHPPGGGGYSGPGAPKVGGRMLMPVQQRQITWDGSVPHTVSLIVAGNATAQVTVPPGAPLAEAWDRATQKGK